MPTTLLDRLLILQANRCFFCDKHLSREEASVEHLVPLARNGANQEHNTVACCKTLNGILGSIELKAKLVTILKHQGKFVCPAGVSSGSGQPFAAIPPRTPAKNKPTAAELTELALNHLRRYAANRPRAKKTLVHHLSTILKNTPAKQIEQVITRLKAEEYLTITKEGKVAYHLT